MQHVTVTNMDIQAKQHTLSQPTTLFNKLCQLFTRKAPVARAAVIPLTPITQPKIISAVSTENILRTLSYNAITMLPFSILNPTTTSESGKARLSQAQLPYFSNKDGMRFYPQAHVLKKQRTARASEDLNNYSIHNEEDTIREMVDLAISKQWLPLSLQPPRNQQHFDLLLLACARATARGVKIDWNRLGTKDFSQHRDHSAKYAKILRREQALWSQQSEVVIVDRTATN